MEKDPLWSDVKNGEGYFDCLFENEPLDDCTYQKNEEPPKIKNNKSIKPNASDNDIKNENTNSLGHKEKEKHFSLLGAFALLCILIVLGIALYEGSGPAPIPYPFSNADIAGEWHGVDTWYETDDKDDDGNDEVIEDETWHEYFKINEDGTYEQRSTYYNDLTGDYQENTYTGTYTIDGYKIYFMRDGNSDKSEKWNLREGKRSFYGFGGYCSFYYYDDYTYTGFDMEKE